MDANPYRAPQIVEDTVSSRGYGRYSRSHGLPLASRSQRFGGFLMDLLVQLPVWIPFVIAMVATEGGGGRDEEVAILAMVVAGLAGLVLAVWNCVWITTRGQSIGKRILGIRIVSADNGDLPGFARGVLVRAVVPAVINQFCSLFSLIDVLFIFGDERRCLHDMMANTIVIDNSELTFEQAKRYP